MGCGASLTKFWIESHVRNLPKPQFPPFCFFCSLQFKWESFWYYPPFYYQFQRPQYHRLRSKHDYLLKMAPIKSGIARVLRSKAPNSNPRILNTMNRHLTRTAQNATSIENSRQPSSSTPFFLAGKDLSIYHFYLHQYQQSLQTSNQISLPNIPPPRQQNINHPAQHHLILLSAR